MSALPPNSPMTPAQPAAAGKTSGLAVAALVLALLPLCITNIAAIVLGIMALVTIGRTPGLKGQGIAIAALCIAPFWGIFSAGCISAIAIPNFVKFNARAKQAEAKTNLKAIYTAEKSTFAEDGHYGTTFEQIHWSAEPTRRYTYFLAGSVLGPAQHEALALPDAVQSYASDKGFAAVAVGNIDQDPTLDVWTINDQNVLTNVVNDATE